MLEIDGSFGEGGGQILRTALSLSCISRIPFRLFNIRKGRKRPGLMPQHLSCAKALAQVFGARTQGVVIGSTEIFFEPGEAKGREYLFDIGTAGSTSLLLQALLLPLAFSKHRSSLTLIGGTHVPFSPTFDYIREVFIPVLGRLGVRVQASIDRYGFYPKGGGRVSVSVFPAEDMKPFTTGERGAFRDITVISGVGNLPLTIAERQKAAAVRILEGHGLGVHGRTLSVEAFGKGTFVFIKAEIADSVFAGFSSLGELGKRAEQVGEEAAASFQSYASSGASLDPHLADQIIPYLAYARGVSIFSTSQVTGHLFANLWIVEKFTGIEYAVQGEEGSPGLVSLTGKGLSFSA